MASADLSLHHLQVEGVAEGCHLHMEAAGEEVILLLGTGVGEASHRQVAEGTLLNNSSSYSNSMSCPMESLSMHRLTRRKPCK